MDAMKLIRSPPVDSCSEYHSNDYSNLEESKADGLSCSPIKVPVLIWQGFIDCAYLAYVVLHFFYFVALPSSFLMSDAQEKHLSGKTWYDDRWNMY